MNKKLPSQASYEELMAALEGGEEAVTEEQKTEEILEYHNNIVPFLSHYNITPGNYSVTKSLLYRLYKAYVEEPAPALVFHRVVGQYLHKYHNRSGGFYQLNLDQFKISKHMFDLLRDSKIDKTKSVKWRKRFETFLEAKNIAAGKDWVAGYVLYEIYLDWCRERKKGPSFSYSAFHSFLKVYFSGQRKTANRSLWFQVNENAANYYTKEQLDGIEKRRSKKKG